MSIRKFAALAIAASVMLGTSGCNFTGPVESLKVYAPSDGAQASFKSVKVRNFIYLVNTDGEGALFGSVINSGLEADQFKIQYTNAAGAKTDVNYSVAAGQKLDLGYGGGEAVDLDIAPLQAGKILSIYVQAGSEVGEKLNVPVLDGTLAEYKTLVEQFGGEAFTPAEEVKHDDAAH